MNETANDLVGQPREEVMAKIEKIDKEGDLADKVGPLRFGFRNAVLQALEKKTNEARR